MSSQLELFEELEQEQRVVIIERPTGPRYCAVWDCHREIVSTGCLRTTPRYLPEQNMWLCGACWTKNKEEEGI